MSHTAMVTPGYAPIEQYSSSSKRGAYTDIYGLGATLYYALTGFPPIPSVERYETDLTEPKQLNPEITPFVNRTIIKALAFKADERYQTVEHFLYDLLMQQVIEEPTKSTTDNKTDKKQAVEETEINIIVPTVSTVPDSIETKNEIVIEATDEISLLNKNETLLPEKSFDQNEEARNIKESLQETKIDDDLASKIELEKNIQLTIPSDVEKTVDYSIDQKEKTETPLKQKLEKPFVPEKKQAEKTLKQDTNEKKPKNKEDNTHKTEKTVVKQILPKTTQETFKKIDNQQPKTEQRSRKPLFIVIGIVSAACIAVLLFFLGIFNTNNTQTAQNGDTISQSNVEKEQTETPIDPTTDTALRVTTEAAEASNDSTTGTNTANSNRDSGNQRTSPYSFDYPVVIVTGGSFLMGCDACNDDSSPAKSVTVNSFSIGIYEVTNKLWKEIMGSVPNNNGCENCPVTKVSWNDVQTFLQKLNQKTGERWRLPTEAEWEYAARGGSRTQNYKFSGANDANKVAWNSQNSGGTVHAVGGKSANELGIYDMSGNVYEWCADKSPTNSSHRIFRSGSWLSEPTECTNAKRNSFGATYKNTELGFRICK